MPAGIPAGTTDFKVASDHYHRFAEDVALFKELGLKTSVLHRVDADHP
ncbi:MAG: family 1 glycosylhydrolase [Micropruina sp.]|nr:family 1 glycosylhydrolase [Micropruina sp.]